MVHAYTFQLIFEERQTNSNFRNVYYWGRNTHIPGRNQSSPFLPDAYFPSSCYPSRTWKTLKQWKRRNEQSILCGRQAVTLKYGKQIRINEAIFYAEVAGSNATRRDYICPRFESWILPFSSHSRDQFQNETRQNGYSVTKVYRWGRRGRWIRTKQRKGWRK